MACLAELNEKQKFARLGCLSMAESPKEEGRRAAAGSALRNTTWPLVSQAFGVFHAACPMGWSSAAAARLWTSPWHTKLQLARHDSDL